MQTRFLPEQLAEPATADAAQAIRSCVHCGFCTATCPTYVLRGDELDSPRGRIYLAKGMLEQQALPSAHVVKHVDRCLSCLACETTCPSGVSYRRVIDKARVYIADNYRRPVAERALRSLLAGVLPYPGRLRAALVLAAIARPFADLFDAVPALRPLGVMVRMGERRSRAGAADPAATSPTRYRVGMAQGCVEPVVDPEIQAATARLLARAGCEVVRVPHEGCCGALSHHMGREAEALAMARRVVDGWSKAGDLDAIIITASGCGTVIRDYGHMLADDPDYAERAARVSARTCDITEWIARIGLPPVAQPRGEIVGYHAACSLQHGQKIKTPPVQLLEEAGFAVRIPAEAHLCCGSAGVYNILQPELADQLAARKVANLGALEPDVIVTGNIGCIVQIGRAQARPVVHIAQLLDWATGGAMPAALAATVAAGSQ
ncbi:glycolate oxidase subunit GlcF [Novosphingobium sp. BL-52-GroH]|uniref:glycolate oxidase subunit GlcF n=1 Tax=Novosphingobium sp. BL-52-GroH TaxID=3349877 RepID=UPI00384BF402